MRQNWLHRDCITPRVTGHLLSITMAFRSGFLWEVFDPSKPSITTPSFGSNNLEKTVPLLSSHMPQEISKAVFEGTTMTLGKLNVENSAGYSMQPVFG